jgi:cell wall-associated NlpC family hydrolase
MKKQLSILATVGILLAQASPASAAEPVTVQAIATKQITLQELIAPQVRSHQISTVIKQLKKRVGRTWYVFSGGTPSGWDCSGLTMWAYEQLGVELPHSANKQAKSGIKVVSPEVGDLVLFGYKGTNTYFHASIYIGNNKVIHAGFKKGQTTSVLDLDAASVKNTKMKFVRVNLDG